MTVLDKTRDIYWSIISSSLKVRSWSLVIEVGSIPTTLVARYEVGSIPTTLVARYEVGSTPTTFLGES